MESRNIEYRAEHGVPEYTLTRKRMKNLRIRVDAVTGEVRVSAPLRTPVRHIDEWVASREDWIRRVRAKYQDLAPRLERGPEAEYYRAVLNGWLKELLPRWCAAFEIEQPQMFLRVMTSQWGSCRGATRRITLNIELARRGYDAAEYVLVHELCHLFEMNHGPRFYALMDRHLPDWRERKRLLGPL